MKTKYLDIDPLRFFLQLGPEKNACFLTGAGPQTWPTVIAFDPVHKFSSKKRGAIPGLKNFLEENSGQGRKIIGFFSYDIGYELYRIKKTALDDLKLPDIYFLAFDNHIVFRGNRAKLCFRDKDFPDRVREINSRRPSGCSPHQGNSKNFRPETTKAAYEKAYRKIKQYIYDGDIYQMNLTHRLKASTDLPARFLFSKVIRANPVNFLAYIEDDNFEILSASPERFVRVRDRRIETCPIKGTRRRGRTEKTDEAYRRNLLADRKEAAELNMITDLLRNDLGRVCETGSVRVAGRRLISKCPSVWHTYSRITGTISPDIDPVDAVISMLPGGSITGCPKKRAMEIIDEIEPTTRSVYTGIIGYVDPGFNMDFNVAIRTIIKKKNNLYLQVGGGIVYDSRRNAEFQETLDKAKSFMKILKAQA